MLRLSLLVALVCVGGVLSQEPSPCMTPPQFTGRAFQHDSLDDQLNRFYIAYDAFNQRRVVIEEQNIVVPGRQFKEYMFFGKENIAYDINLTLKTCVKSTMPGPFRPFGIPLNATFENEFTIGGPSESILIQQWSDRIPYRQRAYWVGDFSLKDCYPVREMIIADYEQINSTITTTFYDIVLGIVNPDDFIPPSYCSEATVGKPRRLPFF